MLSLIETHNLIKILMLFSNVYSFSQTDKYSCQKHMLLCFFLTRMKSEVYDISFAVHILLPHSVKLDLLNSPDLIHL